MDKGLAFSEVYASFGQSLRAFIRSRVSDEHAADDLLQETFLRVYSNLDGLEDRDRLVSWVFRIARNRIKDYYRSRSKDRENLLSDGWDGSEEKRNLNEEIVDWLPRFVNTLPETCREAVRLYEFEGLSQKEVAERLGISLSGAKSRIQRGRVELRNALRSCCSFELDRRGNVLDCEQRRSLSEGSSSEVDACPC